jgi:hypothetical protein
MCGYLCVLTPLSSLLQFSLKDLLLCRLCAKHMRKRDVEEFSPCDMAVVLHYLAFSEVKDEQLCNKLCEGGCICG